MESSFQVALLKLKTIDDMTEKIAEQLKPLQDKAKKLKESKEKLQSKIILYMNRQHLQDQQITLHNNIFAISEQKTTETISKKYLEKQLNKYFSSDAKKVKPLLDFIWDERKTEVKKYIKISEPKMKKLLI